MILENISYSTNAQEVLKSFSMNISKKGKLYLLSGPNGSGKSTVLKIMSGVIKKFEGFVQNHVYKKVHYCHDSLGMFQNFTGTENIKHFNKVIDSTLLEHLLNSFEMAFDINKQYSEMSLGMRMKTALITTFIAEPDLIVLDEPLNGLDRASQNYFLRFIQNEYLDKGKSVLICSHFSAEFESLPIFEKITL